MSSFRKIQIILIFLSLLLVIASCTEKEVPTPNQQPPAKCGDGICGPLEQKNPNLCPVDCKSITKEECTENWLCTEWSDCISGTQGRSCTDANNCQTSVNKPSESEICTSTEVQGRSLFGIHGGENPAFEDRNLDIGVKTIRYAGTFGSWDMIEKKKGTYDFSAIDKLVTSTYNKNIEIVITVRSFNRWDQGVKSIAQEAFLRPKDMDSYLRFLSAFVERYDADSSGDAPGSPVVNYWQIENELDGNFWSDTPENYAILLSKAYKTVKSANPNALVVMGGSSSPAGYYRYYTKIFEVLDKNSFDVFDIHWYGYADDYNSMNIRGQEYDFKKFISDINEDLVHNGYANIPIWMSETGTHGGVGVVDKLGKLLPEQDERAQASNLVKRYVYYGSHGIDVVMWFKMIETHQTGKIGTSNGYFENTGLVNNPLNDGNDWEKLAYYSYKKMVDMLEGSDWNTATIIQESNGIYIYKIVNNGKTLWIAWNDNLGNREVTISDIPPTQVKIIEAVPNQPSGKEVKSYSTLFSTESKAVKNNKLTLTLADVPVFIVQN